MIEAIANQANFHEAALIGADLSFSHFPEADFTNATFRWAKLNGALFGGANLDNADLSDTSAHGADFRGATLIGADLRRSDMSRLGAFSEATNFSDANLYLAKLAGADLTGAVWRNTTCPNGSNTGLTGSCSA